MKSVQYSEYGGIEVLKINEIDKPVLKEGQVLVEIKAAAINPFDCKLRAGVMKDAIPLTFPVTIGADFAGIISTEGNQSSEFKAGDEVYGSAIVLNGGSGAVAQYAAVNVASLARKPGSLSFAQAAALVLVGVSAIQALDGLQLSAGQKILIHGGAGGIGSVAIQYAKYLGAIVATTAMGQDEDFVTELGADTVINYEQQQFEDVLSDYDAVYDTIGGDTYANSFKILKRGGRIVSMVAPVNEELAQEHGVTATYQSTQVNTASLNRLTEVVDAGAIKSQVDSEFSLDQVADAYKHLENGHPKGKIVITMV